MEQSLAKLRYDGSVCMNVRAILTAVDLLVGRPARGAPMTRAELDSVLWFVELAATSRNLFFDGTTPDGDVQRLTDRIGVLSLNRGLDGFEVRALETKTAEETLQHSVNAMRETILLIDQLELRPGLDRPLAPEDHEQFFRQFTSAAADASADDREARALELASKRFRGSKCLAAIVSAGPEVVSAVWRAYESHPSEAATVTSALINRFRLNYLNHLASTQRAAYAPNLPFEPLSEQHVRLFKDYLLKKLMREVTNRHDRDSVLQGNLQESRPHPPIGLYALMLTKDPYPAAILSTAIERFKHNPVLRKFSWQATEEALDKRPEHERLDDFNQEVSEIFETSYRRLKRGKAANRAAQAEGQVRRYLLPALLTKAAAMFIPLGTIGSDVTGQLLQLLAAAGLGVALGKIGDALKEGGINSYMTEYRKFADDLGDDLVDVPFASVAEKVEAIFGRPLADEGPSPP